MAPCSLEIYKIFLKKSAEFFYFYNDMSFQNTKLPKAKAPFASEVRILFLLTVGNYICKVYLASKCSIWIKILEKIIQLIKKLQR